MSGVIHKCVMLSSKQDSVVVSWLYTTNNTYISTCSFYTILCKNAMVNFVPASPTKQQTNETKISSDDFFEKRKCCVGFHGWWSQTENVI